MKLSAYYKKQGCNVKLINDFSEKFDIAYISKTFNIPAIKKIPQLAQMPIADEIYLGGTGFAIEDINGKERYRKSKDHALPYDIEHIYPDYGLYSELTKNTAFGFLTRGCPNSCSFCVVSRKEGLKSVHVADLPEFWHDQSNIKLMDANLLACDNAENLLNALIASKANIDFTQGIDARLVDDHTAQLFAKMKIKMIHFAFDLMGNEAEIIRGLNLFRKYSPTTCRERKVYILTNYNTTFAQDWYRVKKVMELGYQPDVRIYRKGTHARFLTDLARWANLPLLYRSCSFEDYIPRKDGKRCGELYRDVIQS
ncbi:MAG: radical SAM protein [Defluviitaleaceae bacterium]|nr:radical SAM protein [Defluviitaleaceae bacterium]